MDAIMLGGLSLFLLKEGSRNQLNNDRSEGYFSSHYNQITGKRLPHMDTVNNVLCALPCEKLDQIRMDLMSRLFEQKWLRDCRLLGKYYLVAVDATGVVSFDRRHCEHCLTKQTKNGKISYFHYVLEAKLVTEEGYAFSLASEWIENPSGAFNKQDCERKAFVRLAAKLKKQYPRLPICILADGLYPYENAFKTCEDNGWKFIFVLQDNSLKTVQEELVLTRRSAPAAAFCTSKNGWWIEDEYRYQTDIDYHGKYTLNWIQCIETRTKKKESKTHIPPPPKETSRFEYVTNLIPDRNNVRAICGGGRLRWKIENEGFNAQKNNGYELEHKFCRKSYTGLQNYYSLMQIAHAINQLIEKGKLISAILKLRPKETLMNLWRKLKAYLIFCKPFITNIYSENENDNQYDCQIRPAPA